MREKENIVQKKSFEFALKIVEICKELKNQREFEIVKQLIRSGTSIGANIEEALGGQSKKDFLAKISIAYKEARETKYWLSLLRDAKILSTEKSNNLLFDCEELLKIIGKIQISTRKSIQNS